MTWGELWHYPFWVEVWGTAGQWVGVIGTSSAAIAAAYYYANDKRIDAKTQAGLVRVEFKALESDKAVVLINNYSEGPILHVAFAARDMTQREYFSKHRFFKPLDGSRTIPAKDLFEREPLDFRRSGPQVPLYPPEERAEILAAGQSTELSHSVGIRNDVHYVVLFNDQRGRTWSIDVSEQRLRGGQSSIRWLLSGTRFQNMRPQSRMRQRADALYHNSRVRLWLMVKKER